MSRGCPDLPQQNKLSESRRPMASACQQCLLPAVGEEGVRLQPSQTHFPSGKQLQGRGLFPNLVSETDVWPNLMHGSCNSMALDFSQYDCRCKALMAP